MKLLTEISQISGINIIYIKLIIKTISIFLILNIIRKIVIILLKTINNSKAKYLIIKQFRLTITILKIAIFIFLWEEYISNFMTLLSFVSASITIALRDIIFNFFSGIYIKIRKPFQIEDRIEINEHKGDVININTLSFELLEVNNENFMGQSTGVITNIPNSTIFTYPLRNYNKAFKYIWNEITIKVPLNCNLQKTKSIIYKIVNSNEIIKKIPNKMKNQIKNVTSEYRIYYNQYDPIIYTQVIDSHIELTVRYLIHPKKARYVNSTIWNKIIEASNNEEIKII